MSTAVSLKRPKVKVCGVTRPDEALHAAALGAEYLGLNFHPPSPRGLLTEVAAEIASTVRSEHGAGIRLVGVFVNRLATEIEQIADAADLDLLQFHGDEAPETIAPFASRAIKVFRIRGRIDPDALRAEVARYDDVWGHLFDTKHPELYGGSGDSWDFSSLHDLHPAENQHPKPTFIAGGLGPDNVRAAITASAPWGVDVCSGVESSPGRKDPTLLERFFQEIAMSVTDAMSVIDKENDDGQSPTAT